MCNKCLHFLNAILHSFHCQQNLSVCLRTSQSCQTRICLKWFIMILAFWETFWLFVSKISWKTHQITAMYFCPNKNLSFCFKIHSQWIFALVFDFYGCRSWTWFQQHSKSRFCEENPTNVKLKTPDVVLALFYCLPRT